MREIKFRVWCKKHKYIYDACSLRFIGDEVSANDNSSCIGEEILMQYTGLKDKNGKEIYEGDIIKEAEYFNCFYEVIYDNQSCRFIGFKIGDRDSNILEFPQLSECGEVIGNIYECII